MAAVSNCARSSSSVVKARSKRWSPKAALDSGRRPLPPPRCRCAWRRTRQLLVAAAGRSPRSPLTWHGCREWRKSDRKNSIRRRRPGGRRWRHRFHRFQRDSQSRRGGERPVAGGRRTTTSPLWPWQQLASKHRHRGATARPPPIHTLVQETVCATQCGEARVAGGRSRPFGLATFQTIVEEHRASSGEHKTTAKKKKKEGALRDTRRRCNETRLGMASTAAGGPLLAGNVLSPPLGISGNGRMGNKERALRRVAPN